MLFYSIEILHYFTNLFAFIKKYLTWYKHNKTLYKLICIISVEFKKFNKSHFVYNFVYDHYLYNWN